MIEKGLAVRGSDIGADVVAQARRRFADAGQQVALEHATIESMQADGDAAPLIVCCEVLEHVDDPEIALLQLSKLAKPYLLTSVPREPLWRMLNMCRGKYLADLGNTPGHLNHWSKTGFLTFLQKRFDVVAIATPLPWTMVLCRSRD